MEFGNEGRNGRSDWKWYEKLRHYQNDQGMLFLMEKCLEVA